jgi:signal transduction histidine kinase
LDKVKSSIATVLIKNAVQLEADFSQAASVHFSNVYLESIMLNLLTNAIKYAHPTRHPLVQIKTYIDAGGNTKLTFSDIGIGMNMAKIKNKIFGLYQRFHNNADAKGIGLYLVHSQVTALGGTIDVESEEGVGTTFTIAFK